ncbi:Fe-S oxidoreductase [Minicystis rosea]|nr:Fe-S oxidoreductase [Minicystis rosea]
MSLGADLTTVPFAPTMRSVPTQVTLERYAEIRAEMEAGALRDDVLSRAGLSADAWTAAQRDWLESMGAEIARGRFELTHRYAQAFVERQRALAAARAPAAHAPSAPATASPPLEESAPRPIEAKPTFLATGAAADTAIPNVPVVRPANPLLSGTMSADVSAFRPALPFDAQAQAAEAPPAPGPQALPAVRRAPAELSGTSMGFAAPKGPALPFAPSVPMSDATLFGLPKALGSEGTADGTLQGVVEPKGPALPFASGAVSSLASPGAGTPATPASAPPVKRAPAELSGTSMGFVAPKGPALPFAPSVPMSDATLFGLPKALGSEGTADGTLQGVVEPKGPALPFVSGAVTPSTSPAPVATPSTTPPVKRAPAELSGTSMGFAAPRGPALPFAGGRPPAESSLQVAHDVIARDGAGPSAAFNAPSALPSSGSAQRLARSAVDVDGTLDSTVAPARVPFASTAEPAPPAGLSLQQYASLCVELAVVPAEAGETLHRYRITAEQRKALDEYWQGRMSADPMVRATFDQAHAAYEAWFVASRAR